MRDDILNVLHNSNGALDIYELKDELQIEKVEDIQELEEELRKLSDECVVYHSNKNKYMLLEKSHLRKGIMRANKKGFGFVEVDDLKEDIYISSDNMNGAVNNDLVLVEITSKMTLDRLEGRILKIIERGNTRFVGEINFDSKGIGHITLDDKKVNLKIEVDQKNNLNAVDGHKVLVELGKKLDNNNRFEGKVLEIIGHKNDPGVDILSIIYKYDINVDFPEDVKEEVKNIPMEVKESDFEGRRDLRDWEIFTIDGDDTKDIDDAISRKDEQWSL